MSRVFLIIGARGAGKSTLADWLLRQLGQPYAGFRTVRAGTTPAGPVYQLVEVTSGRRAAISRRDGTRICSLPQAFDGFAARVVEDAVRSSAPVLLLDEIGRFERNSPRFLAAVDRALDSGKTVVAVLKKEELPHLTRLRARPDAWLTDLDAQRRGAARRALRQRLAAR